jgi:glycosyltransferase involved in cell wall biosynthesis
MIREKVSIIMPCYNAGKYIGDAIQSVLNQNTEYQLIIVDDGSTDDTLNVVKRYSGNINLVQSTHSGVANARNKAISQLTGDYVLLLDADDSLEQGALGILLNAVSGKKGVAYGRFSSWDPKMEKCLYVHHAVRLKPNPFISLSRGNFSPPGSMLFPSSVFNEIGDFDQDVAGCEDWDFLIRLARAGYSFRRVNKPVFKYRRHVSSASNQAYRMYLSGRNVIQRCFQGDPRVARDRYPGGNTVDDHNQALLNYCASCFASAILSNDIEAAKKILLDQNLNEYNNLKSFGRSFMRGLWWHSLTDFSNQEIVMKKAQLKASEVMARCIDNSTISINAIKNILYPEFGQLLLRPGPKKAYRLLREWLAAREVVEKLFDDNEIERKTTS